MSNGTGEFGDSAVSDDELTLELVPAPDADFWMAIAEFALTFDGYDYWGSFDTCAGIANAASQRFAATGALPDSLLGVRTCLFFEQRRWRHFNEEPSVDAMSYIRALVERTHTGGVTGSLDHGG